MSSDIQPQSSYDPHFNSKFIDMGFKGVENIQQNIIKITEEDLTDIRNQLNDVIELQRQYNELGVDDLDTKEIPQEMIDQIDMIEREHGITLPKKASSLPTSIAHEIEKLKDESKRLFTTIQNKQTMLQAFLDLLKMSYRFNHEELVKRIQQRSAPQG